MSEQDVNKTLDNLINFQDSKEPLNPIDHRVETSEKQVYSQLSEERQAQSKALAKQINEGDLNGILSYGSSAQDQLSNFSQSVLDHIQSKDTGEIGESLTLLVNHLERTDPKDLKEQSPLKRLFRRSQQSVYELTAKYQEVGGQIDRIAQQLNRHKDGLLEDNEHLEGLYQQNLNFYEALNIYIAASELKLEELSQVTYPQLLNQAEASGNQVDLQKASDLQGFINRLEKRRYDLLLAREVTIQQAPQIRLIQNTNQSLAEKIQSSIHTAIPLWKNQVAISLTLNRQKNALLAQQRVSKTTNDLLKQNSELMKTSAIETAKENERGIIDIETLQQTQDDLMESLEEVITIQNEGRQKRHDAEQELIVMENQLKERLLKMSQNKNTSDK